MINKRNDDSEDPIKHVVLLIMENHSFDQMLGCFQSIYEDLEGVNPSAPFFNFDMKGNKVFQKPCTETQIRFDPHHDLPNVLTHLSENNGGFVKDFITCYPNASVKDCEYVMGYYPLGFLPGIHPLAKEFTICDHWFSSLPGPTWPNRFFALSGTSSGRVRMPQGIFHPNLANALFDQDQDTLFDRLNEAQKTWKIYYYDFPLSLVLTHQREPHNLVRYDNITNFFKDARGKEADFPAFTLIEPKYLDIDQNDDHPPHNVMKAQKLIADVYNAIRSNPKLWESTLLVIFYDEHGGFYDHVIPPKATPPDAHTEEYTFDQLGVRVPALLISPWVGQRVEKNVFDHTSLLKYLIEKWQLNPLGKRTGNANSIKTAICFNHVPRMDTIPFIRVPNTDLISKNMELEKWSTSINQQFIHLFADFLADTLNANDIMFEKTSKFNSWAKFKKAIGSAFIHAGYWLEHDLKIKRHQRIARTCEVANRLTKLN